MKGGKGLAHLCLVNTKCRIKCWLPFNSRFTWVGQRTLALSRPACPAARRGPSVCWHLSQSLSSRAEHPSGVALMNGSGPHDSLKGEKEPRQNGHEEPEPGEDGNDQEVIVIQDTGFTVKIYAPGIEPFSLQVPPVTGSGDGDSIGGGGSI